MTRRSPFRKVPVVQLQGVFTSIGFKPAPRLFPWLTDKHCNMVLSQLSEDAVKRISKSEISNDNQGQSMERSWATLVETNLLGEEPCDCCRPVSACHSILVVWSCYNACAVEL